MAVLTGASFRTTTTARRDVITDPPEASVVQRRARNQQAPRTHVVRWPLVTTAEKNAILAEVEAAKGGCAVLILDTGEFGYLADDSLRVRRRAAGRFSVEMTLESP